MTPPSAAQRRAQRQATARALTGLDLGWADLDACPAWLALPGEAAARDWLCAHAGAWWLAASLRACIDGRRLAQVCSLLGEVPLAALRESPDARRAEALDDAPRPLLPPAEDTPAHLLACGRALLGWSLPPTLRAPVLAHLGWPVDERHYAAFDTHRCWALHALHAAQQAEPTPADPDVALLSDEDSELV